MSSDGSRLAVGCSGGASGGGVVVYEFSSSTWTPLGGAIDAAATGEEAGAAVALNAAGDVLCVGSPGADVARCYAFTASAWVQLGGDIPGAAANDQTGASLALSDDGLALCVGSPAAAPSGAARVFAFAASAWTQTGSTLAGAGGRAGASCALSSDASIVVVGAPNAGSGVGSTQAYVLSGSDWVELG